MVLHNKLSFPFRQLASLFICQLVVNIVINFVSSGCINLNIITVIFLDFLFNKGNRLFFRCAAPVADSMKNIGPVKVKLFIFFQLVLNKVPVAKLCQCKIIIVWINRSIDVISVNTIPFADVKRCAVGRAPCKLLRCETLKVGVVGNRRQSPAKAKAIGEIDIYAPFAEGFVKIRISYQNISEKGFRRRNIDIAVFIA